MSMRGSMSIKGAESALEESLLFMTKYFLPVQVEMENSRLQKELQTANANNKQLEVRNTTTTKELKLKTEQMVSVSNQKDGEIKKLTLENNTNKLNANNVRIIEF